MSGLKTFPAWKSKRALFIFFIVYFFEINFSKSIFLDLISLPIIGISISGREDPPQLPYIVFPLISSKGSIEIFCPASGCDANIVFPPLLIESKACSMVFAKPEQSTE